MKTLRRKKVLRAFFVSLLFVCSLIPVVLANEVPTGLLEIDGLKYPVFLYIPDQYDHSRPYPMVMSFPSQNQSPEEHIQEWKSAANRKSVMILVPHLLLPREGTVPYTLDKWILKVKNTITSRFKIAKGRIYLVGHDKAAHYAAYLGANYPDEFSAAATLNGSWNGPLEKLIKVKSSASEQIPFFLSFDSESGALLEDAKPMATKFTENGYVIHVELLEGDESFEKSKFKRRLIDWLEEKAEKWKVVKAKSDKSMKTKIKKWFIRNYKVK